MDTKNTYHPDDIEQLLIEKDYNELSEEEKNFVDSQIESPTEYNELRNTLISIKKIAAEEQAILVSPSIKEDLLAKFEKSKSKAGWFSLNSIGAFLFPANTPLFKKPGLQFALAGTLLLLVINVGLYQFDMTNSNLAINSNEQKAKTEIPAPPTEKLEKEKVETIKNFEEVKEEIPAPIVKEQIVEEVSDKRDNIEQVKAEKIQERADEIEIPTDIEEDFDIDGFVTISDDYEKTNKDVFAPAPAKKLSVKPGLDNKTDAGNTISNGLIVQPNYSPTPVIPDSLGTTTVLSYNADVNVNRAVSLSEVTLTEGKVSKRKKTLTINKTSQSLAERAEVIDLLFVTE